MKLKKPVKRILIIILIIIVAFIMYKYYKSNNNPNNVTQEKINETLKFVKDNNIYDEKYKDEYEKITYQDNDNFKDILVTFLPKGYKGEEINYILKLSNANINKLKDKDYIDISNYYTYKNFNVDNIDRYNKYYEEHNDYSYDLVITYVNIKLDLPVYTDPAIVSDGNDLLVLVNKYNCLEKTYRPNDLDYASGIYGNVPMRKMAKDALVKLQEAVKNEINIELLPTTAYRDYSFQSTLYNNYVKEDGVAAADTYSARPGCSEHQTGLAIDLKNPIRTNVRLSESDYAWLKENAYRFGFIIRFPGNKEFVTGYQEENWHIRYVGMDAAKIIHDDDLTLEEYIDLYVNEY